MPNLIGVPVQPNTSTIKNAKDEYSGKISTSVQDFSDWLWRDTEEAPPTADDAI